MTLSPKRVYAISGACFLFGLAILVYTSYWWPGILLVIGLSLAIRHFFLGRSYDLLRSLGFFIGLFVVDELGLSLHLFFAILLTFGATLVLLRRFRDCLRIN